MTKDEALKMAIEALETAEIQSQYDGLSNLIFKAIQDCKDALEQPTMTYEDGFAHGYEAHRAEQALKEKTHEI
jgi:hypothetical protein